MTRVALVAGVQLLIPLLEQCQRLLAIANLVAEVVRDAAIGIDGVEVRAKLFGQKPTGYVEVFVVRLGQMLAPGASLSQRGATAGMR
jgi:hypothetical protein